MRYGRATLFGVFLLTTALIAVDLTASAMQMGAMHAGNKRVAAWTNNLSSRTIAPALLVAEVAP